LRKFKYLSAIRLVGRILDLTLLSLIGLLASWLECIWRRRSRETKCLRESVACAAWLRASKLLLVALAYFTVAYFGP
jgi:hypothetical protein